MKITLAIGALMCLTTVYGQGFGYSGNQATAEASASSNYDPNSETGFGGQGHLAGLRNSPFINSGFNPGFGFGGSSAQANAQASSNSNGNRYPFYNPYGGDSSSATASATSSGNGGSSASASAAANGGNNKYGFLTPGFQGGFNNYDRPILANGLVNGLGFGHNGGFLNGYGQGIYNGNGYGNGLLLGNGFGYRPYPYPMTYYPKRPLGFGGLFFRNAEDGEDEMTTINPNQQSDEIKENVEDTNIPEYKNNSENENETKNDDDNQNGILFSN